MLGWWRCLVMLHDHVHFVSVFVRSKKTTSIYVSWSKWCVFRGKGCTWLGTGTKAYGTSWYGISQSFQHHKLSSVSLQYCLSSSWYAFFPYPELSLWLYSRVNKLHFHLYTKLQFSCCNFAPQHSCLWWPQLFRLLHFLYFLLWNSPWLLEEVLTSVRLFLIMRMEISRFLWEILLWLLRFLSIIKRTLSLWRI